MSGSESAALADASRRVRERIARAAESVGRDPAGIRIVAVTKEVPEATVRAAVGAGLRVFGENRVQEAQAKYRTADFPEVELHLIGRLQPNKARKALDLFDVIETVDSVGLARRLDLLLDDVERAHRVQPPWRYPILLQVNVDADPAKGGFAPAAVGDALAEIEGLRYVRVEGLMTVGRLVGRPDEARPTFRALQALADRLRSDHPGLGPELSMGMTDDFEVAVEEGATLVRIGRALFGARPAG